VARLCLGTTIKKLRFLMVGGLLILRSNVGSHHNH
jgi:hypothetical protein